MNEKLYVWILFSIGFVIILYGYWWLKDSMMMSIGTLVTVFALIHNNSDLEDRLTKLEEIE